MEQTAEAGAAEVVATFHGVRVPAAPHLTPAIVQALQSGQFERRELVAALATIRPSDRVLEFGAGSGAVGAAIALNCRPSAMLSFEANPDLVAHARALLHHNGVSDLIELRHGVVLSDPDAPTEVDFLVRGNFLSSRLELGLNLAKARRVTVPVWRYGAIRQDFPHDVIVMDIEGAEHDFLRHADLAGVRLVVAELHPRLYGEDGARDCRRALRRAGFAADPDLSGRSVCVFRRDRT